MHTCCDYCVCMPSFISCLLGQLQAVNVMSAGCVPGSVVVTSAPSSRTLSPVSASSFLFRPLPCRRRQHDAQNSELQCRRISSSSPTITHTKRTRAPQAPAFWLYQAYPSTAYCKYLRTILTGSLHWAIYRNFDSTNTPQRIFSGYGNCISIDPYQIPP